jgi:serine phosphatase RsbU (regulator of sigma subunit)
VDNKVVVAAIDCTGHGVPGAFMSLIGNTLMNEIVNEKKISKPSEILEHMHAGVLKALRQEEDGHSQDGMDVSLCVIDNKKKLIEYAGAMNPVYLLKEDAVTVIKPDLQGIGGKGAQKNKNTIRFTDHVIPIEKGMQLYLFTDGYMDQFGGLENKKFNTSRFKEMLLKMGSMDMSQQKKVVAETMNDWRKGQKQIDDMLVIGIRFGD